ncbi:MAG: translation initiation factor IF-2 [Zetaproteobacteria bacterium CG_4_9_14_3_um_filter_54_145]|nr:MAG: translation initiation factor IF-2 [Zetaproteobacteria bacterium CG_4_10_14_3_um_filter_54_28]PJA29613.1 MAG: translation initiation factor IF-2 [Zetaproteobacteria bacterium CG_4_9_14_3_um_filter_54_145]
MAKRILDLAKELGVDAAEIQRVAVQCNVVVSGPTSTLDNDDQIKIRASLQAAGKSEPARAGGKTLTLNRPMVAGQPRSGGRVEGRGRSVEVSVRRRHTPAKAQPVAADVVQPDKPAEVVTAPVVTPKAKPMAPAQRAAAAVEQKKQAEAESRAAASLEKAAASEKAAAASEAKQKSVVSEPVVTKPEETQKTITESPVKEPVVSKTVATPQPAVVRQAAVRQVGAKPGAKPAGVVSKSAEPAGVVRRAAVNPAEVARTKIAAAAAVRAAAQEKAVQERIAKQRAAQARTATNAPAAGRDGQARPAQAGAPARTRQQTPGGPNRGGPQGRRPAAGPAGAPGSRPGATSPTHKGPRTTIRRGLTPAQIAASKAPSSSLKQIEQKISEERATRRKAQQRPTQGGPGGAAAKQAMTRRGPSVAVSPSTDAPSAPTGPVQRRRGAPGAAQRGQRRLSPAEKAARRDYASKRNVVLTPQQEERMARLARGSKRRNQITKDDDDFVVRTVEVTDPIMISELASRMAIKSAEVVKKLFEMGSMVTVNEGIDGETAVLIVEEFGHKAKIINAGAVEDVLIEDVSADDDSDLQPRPPVVVVMGHVDHGKTSILDALRKAHVADGEAGGITQHIGAYMVKLESGERVVFIDTPGHEAFTSLRARGAGMTDVAVLVVAADDGVMPQTVEALNHARAANVPMIVAVNKMDKEGADPERVMRQLADHGVLAEQWGGDTIFVPVSARSGLGLDELLDMLALQTEILELNANPTRRGKGIVIESRLDRGRGPVATVLVQNGTFKQGDTVVVGSVTGRIRAIVDENGKQHRTAGPSIPFELLGLDSVPESGQELFAVENEKQARDIVRYRKDKERELGAEAMQRATMDELFANLQSGMKEVPVVIKGDVTGSVEAMADSLARAGTDEVKVKVIHKGIGGINESDVMLASASNAIVIGFNVRPEAKAKRLAEQEGIDIRFYKIIYDAIDDMRAAMAGVLSPNKVEKVTGMAEVREVFMAPKIGAIAGCYVTEGFVTRGSHVRVLRDDVMIYDGLLASLRRFRDDVKEVKTGFECGIGVEKFNDVKEGDNFEFYVIEEVAATL